MGVFSPEVGLDLDLTAEWDVAARFTVSTCMALPLLFTHSTKGLPRKGGGWVPATQNLVLEIQKRTQWYL